jgi:hypothetical protein
LVAFTAAGGMLSMAAYSPLGPDGLDDDVASAAAYTTQEDSAGGVVAAVTPVASEREAIGAPIDVEGLVKSVTLAEEAVRQAEARKSAYERCVSQGSTFGGVQAAVAEVGNELRCRFGVDTVYGVAGRANASDHPAGRALDLMVDRATGEKLAEYAASNRDRLGVEYVIYRQRIDSGDGWERMPDRGGATANHMDHVHISFDA